MEPTNTTSRESLSREAYLLLDAELIQAARQIYQTYYEVHPDDTRRPYGIAISRKSRRGKLIYTERPILLPQETFIPLNLIEAQLY
jgi:hypothetical protein